MYPIPFHYLKVNETKIVNNALNTFSHLYRCTVAPLCW